MLVEHGCPSMENVSNLSYNTYFIRRFLIHYLLVNVIIYAPKNDDYFISVIEKSLYSLKNSVARCHL